MIVKHWGKLVVIFFVIGLLSNYNDVVNGFNDGYNKLRHTQSK